MADDFVQVAPDSTGKKIDNTTETTGAGVVERQRVSVAGVGGNNQLAIDAAGKIGVNNFPATQPVSVALAAEVDGHSVTLGATTDTSAALTVIGRLKALVALFAGGLPAALAASGGLKVDLAGTGANATAVKVDASSVAVPLAASAAVIGHVIVDTAPSTAVTNANLDVALSTRLKPADTLAGVTTVAAVTAITNALPTGSNKLGTVDIATAPAVAKGTQGANGVPTQDLKDSGRVNIMWTAEVAGAATSEGLLTVTESRDGAATTTFTTKVVTSGKRLRITSAQMAVETLGSGTAPQRVYLRMRFNTAGAVTTGSPLQGTWEVVNNAAIVKSGAFGSWDFPDGIEYLGDGTKTIGFTITFPDWVTSTATVQAKITIFAYEY